MEASALNHAGTLPALAGRSPLLRLKSDEQLITLVRRGQHAAFEALVQRYQSRLLAFCRHMLGSTEDAEDVLQEVFAASFNAMIADHRPINARPWLYRIARNRCLNHLRRPQHAGQDSMDVFERDGGLTTADAVHKREEFRQIVSDVQDLPETQKTALLLREIDALSYDQIAEAMETTVPSVKSLLVRARVSLAEAAEARLLTCNEVRLELGQVAEGLTKTSAPARRHLKACERCRTFRGELRKANRALAAVYPLGPLIIFKKFFITKLGAAAGGTTAGTSAASAGVGGAGGAVASAAGAAAGGSAGSALSAGVGALATKAAAGLAAAALVTAGAVEVKHVAHPISGARTAQVPVQIAAAPRVGTVQPASAPVVKEQHIVATTATADPAARAIADAKITDQTSKDAAGPSAIDPAITAPADLTPVVTSPLQPGTGAGPAQPQPIETVQEDGSTVVLGPGGSAGGGNPGNQWDQPGESPGAGSTSGSGSGSTSGSGAGSTSGSGAGSTSGSGAGSTSGSGAGSTSGASTMSGRGAGSTNGPGSTPPGESSGTPGAQQPAPPAGERLPNNPPPVRKRLYRLLHP